MKLLLALLLFVTTAHAEHRYAIPLTAPGASIFVQNATVREQHIRVQNGAADYDYNQPRYSTYVMPAYEKNYVLITSEYEIKAWSSVEGATFEAVKLTSTRVAFTVTTETGLAIASPWPEQNHVTFWVFAEPGYPVEMSGSFTPNALLVMYARDFFSKLPNRPSLVIADSVKPLAVGPAREVNGRFEAMPIE